MEVFTYQGLCETSVTTLTARKPTPPAWQVSLSCCDPLL